MNSARKTIERFDMLSPEDTVVIGVSGGADSVGLLYLLGELEEYRLKLIVAHLNHGMRSEEGKRDADFVKELAGRLDLAFELEDADAPAFKKQSNLSLEEAARILRYRFLNEVRDKYGAQKIATGHTLDDQAETILMRLIRGSGPLGLSGIPPVSEVYIIRPLIRTPKSEIEEYLKSKGVVWVEDSTNSANVFLRNKIRHDLIPRLQKYNPKIKETLARTGSLLRTQEDFIKGRAGNWLEYVFQSVNENEFFGTVSRYKSIPEALRFAFLRTAIERLKGNLRRISFKHIASVDELLTSETPSGEISIPDEIIAAKGYDLFIIARKSGLNHKFSYTAAHPGKWSFPHAEFEIETTEAESLDRDRHIGLFNPDAVEFPIQVRNFEPGDRFVPLGMKTPKKVKRFFIDEKTPKFLRNRIPIFLSKGEIIWVGGMRIDERFKAEREKAIEIRLIRPKL